MVLLVVLTAFCFAASLSLCSFGHASVIYWGLPAIYSQGPGNFIAGALSNMTARGYGAYAFTDYASGWGLNNPAVPTYLGPAGAGMGITNLSTWGQMYPLAPTYGYNSGYNSAVFNNPWTNFSLYPTYNLGYSAPNYSLFTPSYLPFNTYNPLSTYSPYSPVIDFTQWTTPTLPRLSVPTTTTTTAPTTTTP